LPFGNVACTSAGPLGIVKPVTHAFDHTFDKDYWDQHWRQGRAGGTGSMAENPPNPYLAREISDLTPGTALDAGCGSGAEAIWLATHGWQVTATDISAEALARAAERAAESGTGVREHLRWVEADLGVWRPDVRFDLVTTHYAHPAMPQLGFYDRIAEWVAPGGTLLIVAHLHSPGPGSESHSGSRSGSGSGSAGHDHHQPPAEASATPAAITARLDGSEWQIVTAEEALRALGGSHGGHGGQDSRTTQLRDAVVRAVRRR
jgi:SAM-dependent methyltransferase